MKLLFITCAPFSSSAGHLARLSLELNDLSKLNEISILCLGKDSDDEYTKNKYKNVSFFHLPVEFDGWKVLNLKGTVKNINDLVKEFHPNLVVLQMEVWDLMRELGKSLVGKVAFATVLHAMPFIVSPIHPSGNFEKDVIIYSTSGIEEYRKNYIIDHYKEAESVFKDVSIIANNKTVAFYFKIYFKNIDIWTMVPAIVSKTKKHAIFAKFFLYDFVYMARMESGKGVEYLADILRKILLLLNRRVTIAILGRADDISSENALDRLLIEPDKNKYFVAKYFGWAGDDLKKQILTKSGVFLYPSHYDNYPTVLNEALAFGLPSVVWDVPFTRLNYMNTKAIKLTQLFNFQQFADNAVDTFKDRSQLSRRAFEFVESFDSSKKIAQLDMDIFEQISSRMR